MNQVLQGFEHDLSSPHPLHRQVEQWLRMQIASGALSPGDTLPPRKEFCELLGGINHLTIRQAVNALMRDGLLYSIPGRGTYVAEQKCQRQSIGVVLPSIDDEFTHALVAGIQDYFGEAGDRGESSVRVVLFDSRRDPQEEIDSIAHLKDLSLDGAIIFPVAYGDMVEKLVQLKADRFPLVLIGWVPGIKFNSVSSDDYAGGYQSTVHLLEKGCRRLAWIGNRKSVYSVEARFEGYRDALSDSGVLYDREIVGDIKQDLPTGSFEDALVLELERILNVDTRPDALVCANDFIAIMCIRELTKRNIRVPEEISVVGFDNIKEAATSNPALTTVCNPMRDLGRSAASLLLKCLEDPHRDPEEVVLPVELIVREST
ncbi:GntR family transcriptional regulator [Coraliomargarita parva]|uniref:GntR family transcriptional regulator n=1 Tax=Coraliomargarita parva TaxID=3014050 RepID=UPI0022B3F7A7|nr:GntR family transcriptional regulator [Coraliomargarita parva]